MFSHIQDSLSRYNASTHPAATLPGGILGALVSRHSDPKHDKQLLKTTALRWCMERKSKAVGSPFMTYLTDAFKPSGPELEATMDTFIDRHLWFLPVPRYLLDLDEDIEPDLNTIRNAVNEALVLVGHENLRPGAPVKEMADAVAKAYPTIDMLRDPQAPLDNQAAFLALLASDAKMAVRVPHKILYAPGFPDQVIKALLQDELKGLSVDSADWANILKSLDEVLMTAAVNGAWTKMPRAGLDFSLAEELRVKGLITSEIEDQIDTFLQQHAVSSGLSDEVVRARIAVSSVLDERPDIGVMVPA